MKTSELYFLVGVIFLAPHVHVIVSYVAFGWYIYCAYKAHNAGS